MMVISTLVRDILETQKGEDIESMCDCLGGQVSDGHVDDHGLADIAFLYACMEYGVRWRPTTKSLLLS